MKAFVVGFGLGAVGGLLFAPKRGERTRKEVWERFQSWINTASETIDKRTNSQGSFGFTKKSSQSSRTEDREDPAVKTLNSATREALIAVHGIGEVLADRIIEGRPFQTAYEVVEKGILPESTFVQLRRELLDKSA